MTDLSVPAALHASSDEEHSLNGLPGQVAISIQTPEAQAGPASFVPPTIHDDDDQIGTSDAAAGLTHAQV